MLPENGGGLSMGGGLATGGGLSIGEVVFSSTTVGIVVFTAPEGVKVGPGDSVLLEGTIDGSSVTTRKS